MCTQCGPCKVQNIISCELRYTFLIKNKNREIFYENVLAIITYNREVVFVLNGYVGLYVISISWTPQQRALYVGTMVKFSLEQHHDLMSTTFQRCSKIRCPLR